MTALVLAALLNLSPGIQLADNVESRHVALSEARLPLVFVSSDELRPSIDAMTREQLAAELRRLEDTRPSLVGPIVLLSVGAVLAIPGAALIAIGVGNLGGTSFVEVLMIAGGAMLTITGVVLVLVGGIMLAVRLVRRGGHAADVDEVRMRIDVLDQTLPTPAAPATELVPPPPPPPPRANLVVPGGLRTVMTF